MVITLLLKASVLLAAALGTARLLGRGAASTRHGLWTCTFVALLALPLVAAVAPALYVPLPVWRAAANPSIDTNAPLVAERDERVAAAPSPTGEAPRLAGDGAPRSARFTLPSPYDAARTVWLAGAAAALAALLMSLFRVRRLVRRSYASDDAASWSDTTAVVGARLGLRRTPRVLFSHAVRTPMAGGLWRQVVFLPAAAAGWNTRRREIVLAHELSHLRCRDPLRHVAARIAVACYWFHPLAWLAARHSSLAREQACDEAVLSLGFKPSDYAQVLLELADGMAAPRATAALPMVERSLLEKRLMAILDERSRPARRHPAITAAAAALVTAAIAAAQPAGTAATTNVAAAQQPHQVQFTGNVVAAESRRAQRVSAGCWMDNYDGSFSGSSTTIDVGGGRTVVTEMIGTRNGARVVQTHFGDLRLCMAAEGAVGLESSLPSQWSAPRIVIETRRGGATEQMEIRGAQTTWRVNGVERPVDAAARQWHATILAVADATWQLSTLHGEVSSLRGEISSIRGEESSLRGQISSLQGEVSSMRGRESSVRGEESSLRGEISSIQGHVSSLRGEISSQQGAISSLNAGRRDPSSADRVAASVRDHEARIAQVEKDIRDYDEAGKIAEVERRIRALDADAKAAAIEDDIRRFDLAAKVAAVEGRIRQLDVSGKVADIERRIQALDVDRRSRALEERRDADVKRLEQAIAAIK